MSTKTADRCLVMFVRFPGRGEVKSRLAKDLGEEVATDLYRFFVEDLLARFSRGPYGFRTAFHPADKEQEMREMLGDEFSYTPQEGGDLGERMKHSFLRCFSEGSRSVVLIGSDIPDLPRQFVEDAFLALDQNDAVIGPAADGGYYLIGFRWDTFNADVFLGLPWGTETVFRKTMEILRRAGTPVHVLPLWRDIDESEDIASLIENREKTGFADSKTMAYLKAIGIAKQIMIPKFSFIIPVWNEEAIISRTIQHISGIPATGGAEIIVVDGNPAGNTIKVARHMGVKTALSERGRGTQMNLGASLAEGEILIFLHADTLLPHDVLDLVETSMEDTSCIAGAFDLAIDSKRAVFRIIEKAASFRSRMTRIPYGDQAIFMRKRDFRNLGGFRDIPIMEDVEIMQRIKKQKGKICILRKAVRTSPRRWEKEGILYTTLRNWLLLSLYLCGVKPEKLVRFY